MKRSYRDLNKYERAYLRKMRRMKHGNTLSGIHLRKKMRKKMNDFMKYFYFHTKNTYQSFKRKLKNMSDIKKTPKKTRKTTQTVKKVRPAKTASSVKIIKKVPVKKKVLKEKKVKKPRKRNDNSFWLWIKRLFVLFIILILLVSAALFVWFSSLDIPSVDNFDKRKISNSTKIYDKTGEIILYDIHENIQRTVVESDKIAQSAKDAIVAIEDHQFYNHHGVVWKSTFRAVLQTLLSKIGISNEGSAGGSTLTQQVIKNTLLTREKTITRKMKEWVLAYKIEKKLNKDQILTVYLNEAPYGGTIYGIQEASRVFFGKKASELSIAESAYLAAIPNLPTFYSPYGPNKDKLDRRQRIVLYNMKQYGFISDKKYREALKEKVVFLPQENNNAKALHFVQYVRSVLEKKYGSDMVENGGLKVITTLDYKLQQKAEKIIKDHIEEVKDVYDATNAALVAIESETGNVVTMVGSRDYFDTKEFDGNFNVAIAPRQPGSSFKPLAYATAFEKGYLPETVIFDTETQFNTRCKAEDTSSKNGCYSPNNYDFKFKGAMTLRDALAQSRNIPAIKVSYLAGVSEVIKKAHEMGITSLNKKPSYYGLGLVLGGGEVSLLELVSAYTTFPNNGRHNKINAILEVTDVDGKTLEKYVPQEERVFSKNTARMISSILSDNQARTPLFGPQSFLYFGPQKDIAGKTGTTNDNRDAWLIGYSSDITVGVWTGNNDNSPMKKGSSISGKPWRKFMEEALDQYDADSFKKYELPENFASLPNMIRGEWFGSETYYIDSISKKLATEFTPKETRMSVTQFDPHTILYSVNKNNPYKTGNSQNDSQFKNWEYGVQTYAHEHYQHLYSAAEEIPDEYDDVHTEDGIINIKEADFDFDIEGVDNRYRKDEILEFEIDLEDIRSRDVLAVLYYINNNFIGSVQKDPFKFKIDLSQVKYLTENNILNVIVEDQEGKKVSRSVNFKIKNLNIISLEEDEENQED